jgi:hypothetical protein
MSKDFLSHAETEALLKGVEEDEPILPPLAVSDVLAILNRRSADLMIEIEERRARNLEIQDAIELLERVKNG